MTSRHGRRAALLGVATLLAAGLQAIAPAAAQSPNPQLLSLSCAGCHGPQGHSPGVMPSLYGRTAESIAEILGDFKAGRRPATVMNRIAKGYSDDDIRALAQEVSRWK